MTRPEMTVILRQRGHKLRFLQILTDAKLKELQAMKATLESLVHCCHGDDRPDCPIIETLAAKSAAPTPQGHGKTTGLRPGRHAQKND